MDRTLGSWRDYVLLSVSTCLRLRVDIHDIEARNPIDLGTVTLKQKDSLSGGTSCKCNVVIADPGINFTLP